MTFGSRLQDVAKTNNKKQDNDGRRDIALLRLLIITISSGRLVGLEDFHHRGETPGQGGASKMLYSSARSAEISRRYRQDERISARQRFRPDPQLQRFRARVERVAGS